MRSRMSLITTSIAFVCMVGVVGKSAAAMEESPGSSLNLQHYNSMLNSAGLDETFPDKRAYTYVSEYKRLPVYNFGIGKRWVDNSDDKRGRQYSFGLGKRTKQYSFGLGKRSDTADYPIRMNLDYLPLAYRSQENLDDFLEEKRAIQPYSFGLGKRAARLPVEGNGKRPSDAFGQRYHFGLGKRMSEDEDDSLE
ncbi:allatostatins [Hylaeus volcanicus]|uniref:allatostatins n=1 Tax=Hylaeus volcanicus TaxID=313075 RepID=UPI0023B7B2C4|nr:allatostatins [Hylaeus volcanicus]XP_053985472.1 allatostatins [Hylaeus volcanicus]